MSWSQIPDHRSCSQGVHHVSAAVSRVQLCWGWVTCDVTSSSDGQEVGRGRLKKAAGSFTGSYKSSDAAHVLFQDPNHSNKPPLGCELMKVVKYFSRMYRWMSRWVGLKLLQHPRWVFKVSFYLPTVSNDQSLDHASIM